MSEEEPLPTELCALCGWPLRTHRAVDRQCLRKPRFVAMSDLRPDLKERR